MLILNNKNTHTYKTGYWVNPAGTEIAIKYRIVERDEIQDVDLMAGMEARQISKVLATTSEAGYQPGDKFKIDGITYVLQNMSRQVNDNENGMFVSGIHIKETYLYLRR